MTEANPHIAIDKEFGPGRDKPALEDQFAPYHVWTARAASLSAEIRVIG